MRKVGEEWDVEPAEAALLARRVHPRQVREVRVHRACNNLRSGNSENTVHPLLVTLQINPLTSAPRALNSATLSLKARISVGQTKVKSSG